VDVILCGFSNRTEEFFLDCDDRQIGALAPLPSVIGVQLNAAMLYLGSLHPTLRTVDGRQRAADQRSAAVLQNDLAKWNREGAMEHPILSLTAGDEVAIMPFGSTSAADVLEIVKISYIRSYTVLLSNSRLYARTDGRGLVTNDYIAPATDEHRLALASKTPPSGPATE
jgi:hypothetical protein